MGMKPRVAGRAPGEIALTQRRQRQEARRGDRPPSRWRALKARADAAIAGADLSASSLARCAKRYDLDTSVAALQDSLRYVIEIDRDDPSSAPLPPGTSKIGGAAHLPPGLPWPTGDDYYFFAQLAVVDLAPLDALDALPPRGWLYSFISERARGRLLYADASVEELATVATPASIAIPEYMRWLPDREHRLRFRPNYFDQGTDSGAIPALIAALPASLRAQLDDIVGNASGEAADCMAGDRLFGGEPAGEEELIHQPLFAQFVAFDGELIVAIDHGDLRDGYTADAECTYRGS